MSLDTGEPDHPQSDPQHFSGDAMCLLQRPHGGGDGVRVGAGVGWAGR